MHKRYMLNGSILLLSSKWSFVLQSRNVELGWPKLPLLKIYRGEPVVFIITLLSTTAPEVSCIFALIS